ncbi:MAG: HPr family phosphocarrier protein [Candidatus Eisenbacteria bacterium]|uniref:HPr family phosphocarrier protein n=1 Tax=Eiseniibacteriota bacterium TaxID=2212470 RepID=A0A849SNA7_UNCEI|nr:HPr family phosphocarrier protein [Candidatus Eisenbacteria bacterium]
MTEADVLVLNESGLHVRTCGVFVQTAGKFRCEVFVRHGDTEVNGKSILGLIGLAAENGAVLHIRAQGPDEVEAVAALKQLVDSRFGGMA